MLDLPEATIVKPFRALLGLAHRRGYPDPTDPALIGPCVETQNGVALHRQGITCNVLDYAGRRLYMTAGLDGLCVYDQLVRRNAGSCAQPGLSAFGLNTSNVQAMNERHRRLESLLDRAFTAGKLNYDEQFAGYRRGRGLPPPDGLMQIIERDIERFEAEGEKPQEREAQTPPAWWWRSGSRKGYRLRRGRVPVRLAGTRWRGPYPTRKQARQDALRHAAKAPPEPIGLFAQVPHETPVNLPVQEDHALPR